MPVRTPTITTFPEDDFTVRDVLLFPAELAVHNRDLETAGEKAVHDVRTYIKPALLVRRILIRGRGPDLLAVHSSGLPLREPAYGT